MTDIDAHELQDWAGESPTFADNRNPIQASTSEIESAPLPPTDHGKHAYLCLVGCTLMQAPVWGFSLSFGVFQEYYSSHSFAGSSGAIATVGTTLDGVMYLLMPVTFTVLTQYLRLRPYCGPVGLVITVASLILSSYAPQIWQLIASQGVLCAIGSALMFSPTTLYLDEWFIASKGMAYGVIWAGKSAGGVIFPFMMSALLERFGTRTTLQAWAVALVILTAPLLFLIKPRLPVSNSVARRPLSWTFMKQEAFWMLQIGNTLQSLGYLLPPTYLSSYAHTLNLPSITGALLLAIYALASAPGSLIHGLLCDRLSSTTVILISSLGSTIAVFVFWGLAAHLTLLIVFAIVYGFFAGGFSTTYSGIVKEMKRRDEGVDTGLVMGMLLGARGIGFVIGGPVSAALLGVGKQVSGSGGNGYSTQYSAVIIYTGITAVFGGWGWMWKTMRSTRV